MAYIPLDVPITLEGLVSFLQSELQSISQSLSAVEFIELPELHNEPIRPRNGMVVLADGTDWNPGSGAGFYGRSAGAWVKLG